MSEPYLTQARTLSMNTSTTGLNVRFLRVTIAIGHGRAGISTGSALSEKRFWIEAQDQIRKCRYVAARGQEVDA